MKKIFSAFLAMVTLIGLMSTGVVAVSAASTPDSQVIEAAAGETVKVKFIEENCFGVDGNIEYSNRNLFSSVTSSGTTQYGQISEEKFILSTSINPSNPVRINCEVILTVKIADNAKVGDTCVVSFTNCELVENVDYTGRSGYTKNVTVKVVKKEASTTKSTTSSTKSTTSSTKSTTSSTKSTTSSTTKKPTASTATATKKPVANLDLTELNKQIAISEALSKTEYTADSWARLTSALKAAKNARYADTQNEVNKATDALKAAIAALVRIDSSALEQLIAQVKSYLEENNLADVWTELYEALSEAEAVLKSGNQDGINAAYTRLNAAFQALKDKLAELGEDKVVIQEVEVPADCDGECHVWARHQLWLILLIISAVLNLGFIVLIVLYYIKRKKNATDNTPLIDYDINDD